MRTRTTRELFEALEALRRENARLRAATDAQEQVIETLRQSEQRYKHLVESASDIIYETDAEGRFTFFNLTAVSLLKYSAEELRGRRYVELIRPDRRKGAEKFYGRQFIRRIPSTYHEFPVLTKDGVELWLGQNVQLRMEEDRVVGFQAVARDITAWKRAQMELQKAHSELEKRVEERTLELRLINQFLQQEIAERKRSEKALRESEASFRLLFADNPYPMWVYDVETLRIIEVNDAAVAHYGYSREEFLNLTIQDLRLPEDRSALSLSEGAGDLGGMDGPGIWRHRKKDGAVIDVEIVSHGLLFAKRRARLVLAHDITERKRLEEQLIQAQKMQSVGRLAGGIAHDFNNILTAVIGYAESIQKKVDPEDPIYRDVQIILKAADRATDLTRQLLAFARKQIIKPTVVDLNALLQGIQEVLRRLIPEDIELALRLKQGLWPVKVDRSQIEQVLLNLAANARDAMPQGGRLLMETDNVILDESFARQFSEVLPGEYVLLNVSDTGAGMSEDVQAHLFEPFFTTKHVGKGTGLGLATVYGIVKQSEGHIWVHSEPNRGTTFKICLPRALEAADSAPSSASSTVPMGTETILLAEDEALVRDIAVQTLRALGYAVLEASNGNEALRLAQSYAGPIHLLLTDMVMPQMGGERLARRLQRLRPNIKVLFISGYADSALLQRQTPGIAFLAKPFTPALLACQVRQVLDEDRSG